MRAKIGALLLAVACAGLLNGCAFLSRASESSTGVQAERSAFAPALSADGRWVAFMAYGDDLVAGDTNDAVDVFVRDNWTKAMTRVSVSSAGTQHTAFRFLDAGVSISDDGRVVAFALDTTGLAPNDDNGEMDVYWHDRDADEDGIYDEPGAIATVLANATPDGDVGNGISDQPALNGDGSVVVFRSFASDLVVAPDQDTNGAGDVFAATFDLTSGQRLNTRIVSRRPSTPLVEANGGSASPSVDASGNVIAFTSTAYNLIPDEPNFLFSDVLINDGVQIRRGTGVLPNGAIFRPALSRDGMHVAYVATATNLVPGDSVANEELFVTSHVGTPLTRAASQGYTGTHTANGGWGEPAISADGSRVAYVSADPDLVPGDTNGRPDVFVHDLVADRTQRASTGITLQQGALGASDYGRRPAALSADGRFVAFATASNLLAPDANGAELDMMVRSAMVPVIDSVHAIDPATGAAVPAVLSAGANQLLIGGGAFVPNVGVQLGTGVTVTSITVRVGHLVVSVDVAPGTAAGARDLVVHNRGTTGALAAGSLQICKGCVSIAAG